MIVLLHVLIALASLGYTTYVFFHPSKAGLGASYALVAATLASGAYLIWSNPAHMAQSCTTGLLYLGLVGVGIVSARARLVSTK
jgi:hypothetical protein